MSRTTAKFGISRKMLLVAILTITTAVAIIGGVGYSVTSYTMIRKLRNVDMKNIIELKAGSIDARLSRAIETSLNFASDPAVNLWFEGLEKDALLGRVVKEKLTQLQKNYDYFTSFAVSNRTHNYWTADNKLLDVVTETDPDDSWFFSSLKKKERVQINIDYNKELGETGVFLNTIVGDLNNPTAVAGVGFRLDDIIKDLFRSQEGYQDKTLLIHKDGTIVISMIKEEIGKNISGLYPAEITKLILSASDESTVAEYEDPGNGDNMILACAPIKSSSLIVINQVPLKSLVKSLNYIAVATVLLAGASLVFVIIVFAFLGDRLINRPVRKIMEFAGKISDGDLTGRIKLYRRDEFGIIGEALNESAARLENLITDVINSVMNLRDSVQQINTGNQDLSQRTSEQASAVEEIAATVEENTSTVEKNADNSRRAESITVDGAQKLSYGSSQANIAIISINEINDSSKKISEIISVINEIAFQTNLLALNAAVEAARAGEQGKGFAVVAGEVRNLAQRSGSAAKEIEELIKDSVAKVENGTQIVVQTAKALKEIEESSKMSARLIAEIAAATDEQKSGMEQISRAINELDSTTQQNAALVEETSSASEHMAGLAEEMLSLVMKFKISGPGKGM